MIRKSLLIISLSGLSYFAKAQIPALKSNTSSAEKEASVIFGSFYGQYDFIISYTRESYWWSNKRSFGILGYRQGHWEKLLLNEKQRKDGKWSKPAIHKIGLNQNAADSIINFFNQNGFWRLDRDSLNINQRKIDDNKNQLFSISDGVNYKFEIMSKQEFLIIESYEPDYLLEKIPEIKCRETFIKCRNFFVSQFNKK